MEQIFPFLGIRFISVNDDYDSRNYTGGIGEIDVAMKSLLYDIYSEDSSVKIKSSLKTRRDSGKYVATFASYGYRKSVADKHRLIPDSEAAEVVQRIFREYDEGKTMYGIAKALNEEGVSPPGKHVKERDGAEYGGDAWDKSGWGTLAVSRILHNEIYLGTVTYNKLPETDVGRRATVAKPREEWSRLEGMHEPIIEAELFERVRKRLEGNAAPKAGNDESPFRGLVICRGCGYRMTRDRRGKSKFLCTHKYRIPGGGNDCAPSIREENLEQAVLTMLQEKMKTLDDESRIFEAEKTRRLEEKKEAAEKLKAMNDTLGKLEEEQMNSYESYRSGSVSRETFLQQKEARDELVKRLKENISEQENALAETEENAALLLSRINENRHVSFDRLDRELAEMLIEKIIVDSRRRIEIVWKFKE